MSIHNYRSAFVAAAWVALSMPLADADVRPDSHAPIGVMADHVHERGEWMFSYRFMHMNMEDNLNGSDSISQSEIVTQQANPFFGMPMQPPTLRIVPTEMTMDMHMFGVMYAPADWLTLMAMTSYQRREMEHQTYAGPVGTTRLGRFSTRSTGMGDTSLAALVPLPAWGDARLHMTLGASAPTADTDNKDTILTPMGTRPKVRIPYPMQLGSGSWDPITGITYADGHDRFTWGAQWRSTWRVDDNDDDYELGDEHRATGWLSYLASPSLSVSTRLEYYDRDNISGQDRLILGPVQTADPDRQGSHRWDLGLGANYVLPGGKHRLAFEAMFPVHENVVGPQMETQWYTTLGWQMTLK